MEVERFDIALVPDHGRPRVVEFRAPAGTLSLHCDRATASLWLFARGPSDGERGTLVFPTRRADDLLRWIKTPADLIVGGRAWMTVRVAAGAPTLTVGRSGLTRQWRLPLGEDGRRELLLALGEWANAVLRAEADASTERLREAIG